MISFLAALAKRIADLELRQQALKARHLAPLCLVLMQSACSRPLAESELPVAHRLQDSTYILGTGSRALDLQLLSWLESAQMEQGASSLHCPMNVGERLRAATAGPGTANAICGIAIPKDDAMYLIFVINNYYQDLYMENSNEYGVQRLDFDEGVLALAAYMKMRFRMDSGRLFRLQPSHEEFSYHKPQWARTRIARIFCGQQVITLIPVEIGSWRASGAVCSDPPGRAIGSVEIDLDIINNYISERLLLLHPTHPGTRPYSMSKPWVAAVGVSDGSVVTIPLFVSDTD